MSAESSPRAAVTSVRIPLLFSRKVKPGDPDNYEANGARLYWPALFGSGFVRNTEQEGVNAMLNYVYAVLRACLARAVCAAGLLPLFGVHHHNKLNPFCLADDLMEPLRPLGDDIVRSLVSPDVSGELTPQNKRALCSMIECKVFLHGKKTHFIPATYLMAQSLAASFGAGRNQLVLPYLAPPEKDSQKQA
jgi:CRISPR-associated protein Cas1